MGLKSMNTENIFQLAGSITMLGWVILLLSPKLPRQLCVIPEMIIPGLLAIAYAGLMIGYFHQAEGGYDSLASVIKLFETEELVLAGWLHYLAFDLFIGSWIVKEGKKKGLAFWKVLSCLPLTFLFGPVGLLLFFCYQTGVSGNKTTKNQQVGGDL